MSARIVSSLMSAWTDRRQRRLRLTCLTTNRNETREWLTSMQLVVAVVLVWIGYYVIVLRVLDNRHFIHDRRPFVIDSERKAAILCFDNPDTSIR